MASALDAVLQLKSQEAAREQQRSDNLTQGLQLFNQARQQAIQNQMNDLQMKASLAEKGLVPDASKAGGFRYDPTLTSPLANILTATKLQADAKTAGNKSIYDMAGGVLSGLTGGNQISPTSPVGQALQPNPSTPSIAINNPVGSAVATTGMVPMSQTSSTDPITGQTTGTTTSENLQAKATQQIQNEILKGPAEASVGKIALANESIKNIDDIKSILFPDGTPKSFDKGVAFQSNTPHINLPFGMQLGPNFIPTEKGQDIFRKMGASLSARQLIQTGVAARPEETQKLVDQFAPNLVSNPESSLKGLNELQSFYKDYLKMAVPEKRLGKDNSQSSRKNENSSFSNESDAIKANLPKGTIITINGRKARID